MSLVQNLRFLSYILAMISHYALSEGATRLNMEKAQVVNENMALAYDSGQLEQELLMRNAFSSGKCLLHRNSDYYCFSE